MSRRPEERGHQAGEAPQQQPGVPARHESEQAHADRPQRADQIEGGPGAAVGQVRACQGSHARSRRRRGRRRRPPARPRTGRRGRPARPHRPGRAPQPGAERDAGEDRGLALHAEERLLAGLPADVHAGSAPQSTPRSHVGVRAGFHGKIRIRAVLLPADALTARREQKSAAAVEVVPHRTAPTTLRPGGELRVGYVVIGVRAGVTREHAPHNAESPAGAKAPTGPPASARSANPYTFSGKWHATWCAYPAADGDADLQQRRLLRAAHVLRLPAAGVEPAAGGRVDRRGDVADQADALHLPLGLAALAVRVRDRDRGQQRRGVRVVRPGVDVGLVGDLDDLAQVHHRDAVGDVAHHRQVVGDEHVRQVQLVLQVLQQVHHLGLDGHVERGDRLVGDDQLGLQGQGPGDADALALAAGELVGVAVVVLRGQAHQRQQVLHGLLHAVGRLDALDVEGRADDGADGVPRVQRGLRVLEHHLDVPAQRPQLALAHVRDVAPLEHDLPGWSARPGGPASCRSWTCRSRTRRPGRGSPRRGRRS